MDIDASGFEELQSKLAKMATRGGRQASKKGMRAAVNLRAKAVRSRAPVKRDTDKWFPLTALPPGAIARDIHVSVKDGETPEDVNGAVLPGKETEHVQYFVEVGHRLVVGGYSKVRPDGTLLGPGRQIGFIGPHPFWRPAQEETEQQAVDKYIDVAGAELEKIWTEE